jgi:hypothetical protein
MNQHDFAGQHGIGLASNSCLVGAPGQAHRPKQRLIKRVGVSVCLSIDMRPSVPCLTTTWTRRPDSILRTALVRLVGRVVLEIAWQQHLSVVNLHVYYRHDFDVKVS